MSSTKNFHPIKHTVLMLFLTLTAACIFSSGLTVSAESDIDTAAHNSITQDTDFIKTPMAVENTYEGQRIFDQAGIYTESEISELEKKCSESQNATGLDIAIVTKYYTGLYYQNDYADYIDEVADTIKDFGNNSVVLFIDLAGNQDGKKEVMINGYGKGGTRIDDEDIDEIIDEMYYDLKSGKYYEASLTFLDEAKRYGRFNWFPPIIISIIVSVIIALIKWKSTKSKYANQGKEQVFDYQKKGKLIIEQSTDTHVDTKVTSVRIESSSSGGGRTSGGGGSRSRSSSGGRHF